MAFNGSGTFNRLYSWVNDAAANIKIRADRMDNEMNGMATALSTCITKDGQTTVTANLPMAAFRHTGVGDAASRNDYASFGQLQDGKANWAAASGTADAITASYSIPLTSLTDGQLCLVRASAGNATATPTFSPNGLTARVITKEGGVALVAGDIAGAGAEMILRYNSANTRWELLNPKSTLVATAPFTDTTAIVKGSADATKLLRFEVNGFTTATTRVLTPPNFDGTIATLAGTETLSGKTLSQPNIVGTTTNNSAAAGSVGQLITANGTSVSLTNGVQTNITSISLTAGDWDVSSTVYLIPAATTTIGLMQTSISATSATLDTNLGNYSNGFGYNTSTGGNQVSAGIQPIRISLASTTTYYLVARADFAVSTMTANGIIRARRIR